MYGVRCLHYSFYVLSKVSFYFVYVVLPLLLLLLLYVYMMLLLVYGSIYFLSFPFHYFYFYFVPEIDRHPPGHPATLYLSINYSGTE